MSRSFCLWYHPPSLSSNWRCLWVSLPACANKYPSVIFRQALPFNTFASDKLNACNSCCAPKWDSVAASVRATLLHKYVFPCSTLHCFCCWKRPTTTYIRFPTFHFLCIYNPFPQQLRQPATQMKVMGIRMWSLRTPRRRCRFGISWSCQAGSHFQMTSLSLSLEEPATRPPIEKPLRINFFDDFPRTRINRNFEKLLFPTCKTVPWRSIGFWLIHSAIHSLI